MARSRKTSDTETPKTTDAERIEDAEVVGETSPDKPEADSAAESAPLVLDEAEGGAEASPETPEEAGTAEEGTFEAAAEEAPEPAPEPAPVPPPPPARPASSSIVPLLIGGAAAALVGFLVARYAGDLAGGGPTPEELAAALAEAEARAGTLDTRVSALEAADPAAALRGDLAALGDRMEELGGALDAVRSDLSNLSDRVETIAMRPETPGLDPAAFDEELKTFRDDLQAAIDAANAEISEAKAEASRISEAAFAAEQSAAARAAWESVRSALDGGGSYDQALAEVAGLTGAEVPPTLETHAADGVATLAELQGSFPEAARAALQASLRAGVDGSWADRLLTFLKVQSGARSLEPREGDSPDAVLSRAEAAVRAGDIAPALALIGELPEAGQNAMSDWVAAAEARQAALAGAAEFDARLTPN